MLKFKEKRSAGSAGRFIMTYLMLACSIFCCLTNVFAETFSEAVELSKFKQKLLQADSGGNIDYLVQLNLTPDAFYDGLLEDLTGRIFYKGKAGYLAKIDISRMLYLDLYGISYRIIDKKPVGDLSERWYIVEYSCAAELDLIREKFEPLVTGGRGVLIRIRPEDAEWLTSRNFKLYNVDESENFPNSDGKAINLPYLSQYRNKLNPGGTCQNTCLAMILQYYGWKGSPDDITRVWGSKTAQTPEGGARVFNSYAEKLGTPVRAKGNRAAYKTFRDRLDKGHPLIVHGYFTAGHVVIANSFDGRYYDCHDPASKWNQVYKGSYNTSVSGKNQKYQKSNFDKAVSPDGMVWWVEFSSRAFIDM